MDVFFYKSIIEGKPRLCAIRHQSLFIQGHQNTQCLFRKCSYPLRKRLVFVVFFKCLISRQPKEISRFFRRPFLTFGMHTIRSAQWLGHWHTSWWVWLDCMIMMSYIRSNFRAIYCWKMDTTERKLFVKSVVKLLKILPLCMIYARESTGGG